MNRKLLILMSLLTLLTSCNQEEIVPEAVDDGLMIIKFEPQTSEKIDVVLEGEKFHQEYSIKGNESIEVSLVKGQTYNISASALLDGDTINYNTSFTAERCIMTCNLVYIGFVINGEWLGCYHYNWDTGESFECPGESCPICHGVWD